MAARDKISGRRRRWVRKLHARASPSKHYQRGSVEILTRMTEPVLRPIRKLVPPYRVGLDFSPLIAALIIIFLRSALIKTLYRIAASMN
jgi:uncharacterized protein YggT (Ycf19 family)